MLTPYAVIRPPAAPPPAVSAQPPAASAPSQGQPSVPEPPPWSMPRTVALLLAVLVPSWIVAGLLALALDQRVTMVGRPLPWVLLIAAVLLVEAAAAVELLRQAARALAHHAEDRQTLAETQRHLTKCTLERDQARQAQARAEHDAHRDPLTRLANREAFLQRLEEGIRGRDDHHGALSLLYVDLDDFKAVNDRWGHGVGDALLCAFAMRLLTGVREEDLSARLGGDEFAVLIDGLGAHEAEHVAQALLERLSRPYGLGPHEITVSASIGVATYPDDASDATALLDAADAAMYQAKYTGKAKLKHACRAGPRVGPDRHAKAA